MKLTAPTCGLRGEYRLVVSRDAAMQSVSHDTGKFPNLITNTGMNRWGTLAHGNEGSSANNFAHFCGRIVVGSGSTTPAFTDTTLDQPLGSFPTQAGLDSESSSYARGWYEITMRKQFSPGQVVGNVSEIGIQHGSFTGALFSRALILDVGGNPTTITVLANDFLTCYYTLRIMIPQEDAIFNILVDYGDDGGEIPTVVTARPLSANSSHYRDGWGLCPLLTPYGAFLQFYDGGLAPATAVNPLGTSVGVTGSVQALAYVPDTYSRYAKMSAGVNALNGQNLKTCSLTALQGAWQFEFDPPLKKDDTQTMELTFGYSWARA